MFADSISAMYRHFTVYDSVVIRPGEVLRERILPPPAPVDFLIDRIGVFVSHEARVDSVGAAVWGTRLEIRDGERTWYDGPLQLLGFDSFSRLPIPLKFRLPQQSGIYVHSADWPVENNEPVTISVAFAGLARLCE